MDGGGATLPRYRMAASVVSICNRALDYLGQKPITSLEDGSASAGILNRMYEGTRNLVLRSYPWNCATARATLAALTTTPDWEFDYEYQLPDDCLRVLEFKDAITYNIKWRIEGRKLRTTEAGPVYIRYLREITDPAEFDPMLADAIAARLAADCAISITGEASKRQLSLQFYDMVLKEARRIDSREQSQDEAVVADTWLTSRL